MKPGPKICERCGRTLAWRKKWEGRWHEIRYCSERCPRARPGRFERELEQAILDRAARADGGSTFCPSEVARGLHPEDWRSLLQPVRAAARRLVARGELEILQRGRRVDPSTARGPIRLRGVRQRPGGTGSTGPA